MVTRAIFLLACLCCTRPTFVQAQSTYATPYAFTTLAGKAGVSGTADISGALARFNFPEGVAVDATGNVYVADRVNHTIRKITSSGSVVTLAGSAGNAGSADGTGSAARFSFPAGAAVDEAGNVYVADTSNHLIRKITPAGVVTILAGSAGNSGSANGTGIVARFNAPRGVAVDNVGNVYVADTANHTIRKITGDGVVTTFAGSPLASGSADGVGSAARFNNPRGVAADGSGNVYVADGLNHTIRKIAADGSVTTLAGSAGNSGGADGTGPAARFNQPAAVAADSVGNIYVVDSINATIRKISATGTVTTLAGSAGTTGNADGAGTTARFNQPQGIAVDVAGNVFTSDTANHTVRKITALGVVTTLGGTAGSTGSTDSPGASAQFNTPYGIAVDNDGNSYVADTANHTVRKITPAGIVTTLAGSPGSSGSTDGAGTTARFNRPQGVATDAEGNLYVSDTGSHTIRKVTSLGVVTTLAGAAGSSGSGDGAGSVARFQQPRGLAVDGAGNIFVADAANHTIRKITPVGVVSTIAGLAANPGTANGPASTARFNTPTGVALDLAGNLYVADSNNHTIRQIAPSGSVSTIAGSAGASGSKDGTGSTARFANPQAVVVDGGGNIYVADTFNYTLRKIAAATGAVVTLAGRVNSIGTVNGPANSAQFNQIYGIAVNAAGHVFAADTLNHTVRKLTVAGIVSTLAGTAGIVGTVDNGVSLARFNAPSDVALDGAGNLYVADSASHTIRKITPAGAVTTLAGAAGIAGAADGVGSIARFNSPRGLVADNVSNVYVADTNNATIRKITPAGIVTTIAGSAGSVGTTDGAGTSARFNTPFDLSLDNEGNLYVADAGSHTIRKITPGGLVSTFAGTPGVPGATDGAGSSARFNFPRGVAINAAGDVFVADFGNATIRKISTTGSVSTLAGLATATGAADGTGSLARFSAGINGLAGLTVDSFGNLYVADGGNHTIRKITPAGVVSTVAGLAGALGLADGIGSAARFNTPSGVAIDRSGNLYAADSADHTIRLGTAPAGAKLPGVNVPAILATTTVESRALAEQPGSGVIVTISGASISRSNGTALPLLAPNYTNPQPYNLSYVVRLLANGQPDPAFTSAPGGDGTVNTVAVQPDGKILVGGTFASFNGVFFKNLARLQADGKADATFTIGSGPDAQVNALALQPDGKILVGGAFQNFGNLKRPYLLRLAATGDVDTTFAPALNGVVNTLALQPDGKILVGGNFTSASGTARTRVARLLASGALDPTFDPGLGADNEVVTLLLQTDAAIVVGGDFTNFAGQPHARVARLLQNGAIDPAFSTAAAANDTVVSLGVDADGKLLLGGSFTEVNGIGRAHLARLRRDGTLDPSFDPGSGANQSVRTVLPRIDGTVFLGGLFDQYQGTGVNGVVAVTGDATPTVFTHAPITTTVNAGATARFVAEATGVGTLSYQWYKDDIAIPGATDATLTLPSVNSTKQGRYTVQVTSPTGNVVTSDATLTVGDAGVSQIINLACRTEAGAGDNALITGFVIGGTGTKRLLVRAAGPALTQFGVSGAMPNPRLRLFKDGLQIDENRDWAIGLQAATVAVGAFPFVTGSKDAALLPTLNAGGYTAQVDDENGNTGVALVEVYDADADPLAAPARLDNLSLRSRVGAGEKILICGVVIAGNIPRTLLLRGVGPRLIDFGLAANSVLADPVLLLSRGSDGATVATNDDWNQADNAPEARLVSQQVGAFPLIAGAKDAALLVKLPPGSYTLQCSGKNETEGVALVEVYVVP